MKLGLVVVLMLALAACSGDPDDGDQSARKAADAIAAEVDSVVKVQDLTEETDPNDLLGRPNGYSAATVLHDSRAECGDGPGVDCGAVIEQWPDEDAAQDRADYIQGILEDSPVLGSEYDYVNGSLLLRVSGALTPSEAEEYEQAFN